MTAPCHICLVGTSQDQGVACDTALAASCMKLTYPLSYIGLESRQGVQAVPLKVVISV